MNVDDVEVVGSFGTHHDRADRLTFPLHADTVARTEASLIYTYFVRPEYVSSKPKRLATYQNFHGIT